MIIKLDTHLSTYNRNYQHRCVKTYQQFFDDILDTAIDGYLRHRGQFSKSFLRFHGFVFRKKESSSSCVIDSLYAVLLITGIRLHRLLRIMTSRAPSSPMSVANPTPRVLPRLLLIQFLSSCYLGSPGSPFTPHLPSGLMYVAHASKMDAFSNC